MLKTKVLLGVGVREFPSWVCHRLATPTPRMTMCGFVCGNAWSPDNFHIANSTAALQLHNKHAANTRARYATRRSNRVYVSALDRLFGYISLRLKTCRIRSGGVHRLRWWPFCATREPSRRRHETQTRVSNFFIVVCRTRFSLQPLMVYIR